MIFDALENLETYRGLDQRIYEGLQLLKTDALSKPVGRYSVRGDDLYYMIQAYETRSQNEKPEAHRKYVDIQYIIAGCERIGIGALPEMTLLEAHPDRDFYLYSGPMDYITLMPGKFAIFWPQDAHAPGIAPAQPAPCQKCVVKIRIE